MIGYLANFLDHVVFIAGSAWFIHHYFKSPPDSRIGRRKWIPWATAFVLIYYLIGLIQILNQGAPSPPPQPDLSEYRVLPNDELRKLVKTQGQLDFFDQTITVRHGPRVLALAGYRHLQINEGAYQLVSIGPDRKVILVSLYSDSSDLNLTEDRFRHEVTAAKHRATLGPSHTEKIHGCECRIMPSAQLDDLGEPRGGYVALITNGRFTYCLVLTGLETGRATWDADFQRVIHSFEAGIKDN